MRNYYKQSLFLFFAVFTTNVVFSQVGIGNTNPKATLDVTAKYPTGTLFPNVIDGLTVPTLTLERVQSMSTTPANILTSTMIYVDNVTGTPAGVTANITSVGLYYWDGTNWQTVKTSKGASTTTNVLLPAYALSTTNATNIGSSGFIGGAGWTPATVIQRRFIASAADGVYYSSGTSATNLTSISLNGWLTNTSANSNATIHIVKYSVGIGSVAYTSTIGGTSLGSQTLAVANGNMSHFNINIGATTLAAGDILVCVIVNNSGGNRTYEFSGQLVTTQ